MPLVQVRSSQWIEPGSLRNRQLFVGDRDGQRLLDRLTTLPGTPSSPSVSTWAGNQVDGALGQFLTNAAVLGIDICSMEGFGPADYNYILGLEESC
jgi:nitroreductase